MSFLRYGQGQENMKYKITMEDRFSASSSSGSIHLEDFDVSGSDPTTFQSSPSGRVGNDRSRPSSPTSTSSSQINFETEAASVACSSSSWNNIERPTEVNKKCSTAFSYLTFQDKTKLYSRLKLLIKTMPSTLTLTPSTARWTWREATTLSNSTRRPTLPSGTAAPSSNNKNFRKSIWFKRQKKKRRFRHTQNSNK